MAKKVDIVFEGGGAKGAVFVGALQALDKSQWTPRRLVGTSAGAITATLLGAGYDWKALEGFSREKTDQGKPMFSTFMDVPEEASFKPDVVDGSLTMRLMKRVNIPLVPGWAENKIYNAVISGLLNIDIYRQLFSFVERGGMFAGDKFLNWIKDKLNKSKFGALGEATLKEFAGKTQSDVSLAISDTTDPELRILNHRTAPDCPVAWAVRMSMSIPFIWQEVIWDQKWGTYLGKDMTGHVIVDGGALSNFPMDFIFSREEYVRKVMGDTDPDAAGNLGLLIDETKSVEACGDRQDQKVDAAKGGMFSEQASFKVLHRVRRIVGALMEAHDRTILEGHEHEVCRLPAKGYGTTEFDMPDTRMAALIQAGYKATMSYIAELPKGR